MTRPGIEPRCARPLGQWDSSTGRLFLLLLNKISAFLSLGRNTLENVREITACLYWILKSMISYCFINYVLHSPKTLFWRKQVTGSVITPLGLVIFIACQLFWVDFAPKSVLPLLSPILWYKYLSSLQFYRSKYFIFSCNTDVIISALCNP